MMRFKTIFTSVLSMSLLSGCLTTSLQTNSTMSQSIFLDPVAKEKRVVFLNIKNTSSCQIHLEHKLKSSLEAKGYQISDDLENSTYILSTNVLYCDKKQENNTAGGALAGGAVGAGISAYNSSSAGGAIAAGAAGALLGGLLAKMSEDTIYQMQVDVNIKQKIQNKVLNQNTNINSQASVRDKKASGFLNSFGGNVRNEKVGQLNANLASSTQQSYESDYVERSTIILAEAVKAGLKLEEASEILEDKIAAQIAGLF
ncbi:conjugal transfer protein TraT [Campylobacter upsaliensis]|nr:conjugal transfer protein TraT [Campylobacter upsaliensis]EAI8668000.1 conjugal transfer protein TraT [Campylobacter upsaliensis]EAJ4505575.1 conjugal transfer protein TraT [Campylobacter upsaliensis]EAJ4506493.1 conjugal transfer protein TraT [Campylobacter upsaliensis]EAL3914241.1 conjugal transfer protein TraT [Campylobacter upsaliensis]